MSVPENSLNAYQSKEPWSGFGTIQSLTDDAQNDSILIDDIYYVFNKDTQTARVVDIKSTSIVSDYQILVTDIQNVGIKEAGNTATNGTFTFTAVKNDGSTNPAFSTTGKDLRLYGKNTLTITNSAVNMTKIVFNISNQGKRRLAEVTASTGTIVTQAFGDETVTWTGNAAEVSFTVGERALYGSDGESKAGQFCFTSIVIEVNTGDVTTTSNLIIPASVEYEGNTYQVTAIEDKTFQNCSGLTSVSIPESVETIGDYAFDGCNNMTQVTVAWLSPLAINSTVFPNRANCTLYVPQGCQAIYQAADYWKEFKEIIDPTIDDDDSVDGIYYTYDTEKYTATVTGAKSDLQEVNIPDNVTYDGRVYTVTKIARAAFQDHDMAAVIVPFTMKEIGYDAFRGCKNLVSMKVRSYYEYMQQLVSPLVVQEGVTNVDVDGTMDPASKGVNRSLAVMEEEAVYDSRNDCNAIIHKATNMLMAGCQTTVIPEDVVKIGDHAFYGQTNLTSISIPSSVTILGSGAFYDCKNLESVVLNEGLVTIGSCAFLNCEKLSSIKIPISVKKIDEFAFVNCKSLNKAIVSDLSAWCAISFINRDSNPIFRSGKLYSDENTEVKELVIPEEVTSIGNYAFYNCDGITSVTLPSSLTSIGSSAFYACDNITSVSLPATVTAIGQDALMGCDLLTTITAYMLVPPTLTAQFANAEKITLYVPRGTKALYEAADYWKDFMEIIEMEEVIDVTDISQLDVAIYTDNVEINKGTQATLSVKMKNNVVAEGFEFNLRLPDGMDVALDQDGFPMVALSTERTNSRKTNTFETVIQNDGSLHILGASTNGSTISGNDGEIVLVTVNVSDEMKEGSYPIVIENIVISDEMAKAYEVESVTSAITIVDYTAGDVNMDGKVNVADYTAIAHHIMGNTPNVFNKKAADANGDGKINVADLTAVAHLIMYGSVERPKSLPMAIIPE